MNKMRFIGPLLLFLLLCLCVKILLLKGFTDDFWIKIVLSSASVQQMKKMKQKKKGRKGKQSSKTTIIPKMSASRQNYIKRFRRNIIRRANETLKEELKHASLAQNSQTSSRPAFKRKMTIDEEGESVSNEQERRVRFVEESNETFENPRWIEAEYQGMEQQKIDEKDAAEEED